MIPIAVSLLRSKGSYSNMYIIKPGSIPTGVPNHAKACMRTGVIACAIFAVIGLCCLQRYKNSVENEKKCEARKFSLLILARVR